jgi:hypothetical protein
VVSFEILFVIILKVLRETAKIFRQDSRSLRGDLNPGPPDYKLGMPTAQPRRSVSQMVSVYKNLNLISIKHQFN